MKVLVAVKRVVDPNVNIRVKADGSGVDIDNVKMSPNPFDETAVEAAVQLKEAGVVSEVVVASIGSQKSQDVIRAALAMGADRGIHVSTDADLEPLAIAKVLKQLVELEQPDLVFTGKQAIDDDSNQTGQMLSALLNWSQGTFTSKLSFENDWVNVTREVDSGRETIAVKLPAVLTVDLRLNSPRFASLPEIMKSKKKPVETKELTSFDLQLDSRFKVQLVSAPETRNQGIKVTSVDELIAAAKLTAKGN
ncbi:electron transfer flavoprotein subunit beta/FixA family protein [Leeia sp. TBRC 13508]|uniref:Electron transfer flavoprotein subunit beta n=1 Tax=Leeia speluncae TaxID=2884804 RepID=A0ABS8DAB0_9NEIS|nr:electron transfer flavoprotein subunit beta/FixA family protein [Leeia speluncae]MCB6185097.1 electron transfer flavoprotein subunit beta/FixA family protein [Leeia speluncae]